MEKIREDWVNEIDKLKKVIKKVNEEKKEFEQQKEDLIKKNNMLKLATERSQLNKDWVQPASSNNIREEDNESELQQEDIYEEIKEDNVAEEVVTHKHPAKSQFRQKEAASSPPKNKTSSPRKDRDSDDSSLFDRADDSENILDSHLGRNEREQIQDLVDKIRKDHSKSQAGSDVRSASGSEDFERDDEDEDPKLQFPKVQAVKKEDVMPQAAKILKYCNENDVDIMEVQNVLFSNFSLTRKVSVVSLKKVLIDKFQFDSEEATLLARYMIEVPEQYKTGNDEDNDKVEYRFDPDRQLSHAKVVSRLQLLMSTVADDD